MNTYLNRIKEEHDKGKKNKFLFFWGHQPTKDGSVSASCFSQWWQATFIVDGNEFLTAEHWMMFQKAQLFKDPEIGKEILKVKSPAQAKKLGRKVKNFNPEIWNEHKFEIVVNGNLYKFEQHQPLCEFLVNTKNRVIVEASPMDRIWGIGMSKNHADIENPFKWRGQNLLGFALMEVRDKLNNKK